MASKSKERHAHGGVSSGHAGRPLVGVATVADLGTATNKAALHSGFKYHGGPIVKCPQIITSFWGAWSDAAHQARATRLNQFITDLLKSRYMNIMTQYGCGFGAGAAGAFIKATFLPAVAAELTEAPNHTPNQSSTQ